MIFLPTPVRLTGTEQEQMTALRSYLCRLVNELERQVNGNLEELEAALEEVRDYAQ